MSIVQISKVQTRRGLQQDLPTLSSGELGWSIDSHKLYIGNGTLAEGAPTEGRTEVLTEYSILDFTQGFSANLSQLEANVRLLQVNVSVINSQITALLSGIVNSNVAVLPATSFGTIRGILGNNAVITYTLNQGNVQRSGQIRYAYRNSVVGYDEEYSQNAATDVAFTITSANSTYVNLNYSTISSTTVLYRIQSN